MIPARRRLRKALKDATFHPPEVPVVANVDARSHDGAEQWPSLLSAQLANPVRWRQTLLQLVDLAGDRRGGQRADGQHLFAELGPGGVLTALVRRTVPGVDAIAVAGPADLDRLVGAVAGVTAIHSFVSERMVISPCAGVFEPAASPDAAATEGTIIEVGALMGNVSGEEVRSPFGGRLMGMLALPGERVQTGQPVAWLRAG